MVLCVIGAFGLRNSVDDLYIMFVFGLMGYYMRKYKFPVAPAVLGLVLGDRAELSLRRALLLSFGDHSIFAEEAQIPERRSRMIRYSLRRREKIGFKPSPR
jgi:TctA family transporter